MIKLYKMPKNLRYIIPPVLVASAIALGVFLLSRHTTIDVLSPAGTIASQQRNLLVFATALMLLIVLPVFGLTFYIAWKYRAGNTKAAYHPEWDHNTKLETLWWGFPCAIILVLAVVAWNSSHALDPYKAIQSNQPPLTIQVVALQWKWLFIYPEQHIATVNYVQFPAGRPVNFEITADAPMNSFWIPRLGGQVYAMSGMNTQLHLMADKPGTYNGSSANLSGDGFADMKFTARSSTADDFATWTKRTQSSPNNLSMDAYGTLALPSVIKTPAEYGSYEPALYDMVIMKYMPAVHGAMNHENMKDMHHEQ
jgi:cytochrome o ubiquinol oxidase subunit 2